MDFKKIKSIYFIGISGAGMSGLARVAAIHGKKISGSDMQEYGTVKKLREDGIEVLIPQVAENVPLDYDLYVYSAAVGENNPERKVLADKGLADKSMTYFTAVGEFMKVYKNRIAISGTHGKTTTTSMLGLVLQQAGLDPTAIVGSRVKAWKSNVRVGKDVDYFIIEACEYKAHMLELHPTAIILTNIEEDHLDYYRDLDHINMTFQKYINMLPSDGVLIRNADDSECREIGFDGTTVSYGIEEDADVMAVDIEKKEREQTFVVDGDKYSIIVPGDFNIYNALSVIAYAKHIGISVSDIQKGLKKFTGTWRRFEICGDYRESVVISDYAHHPTAVTGLLKAAKEWFPGRRILLVFQPHQHNRTKKLFDKFVSAFDDSDLTIIQEIFDVAGREEDEDQAVTSQDLVEEVEKRGKLVLYSADNEKTKLLLAEHVEKDDVIIIAGAGDIYMVAEEICSKE
ncbi:MAG: UDP-N-acetylmuramate--L-alanine ligase [bacterium]|nr:UDP-N-acetylmuramate--L-alanine ligase [bacterium]